MFLDKIKDRSSGLILYGITPPKEQTLPEKVIEIAEKTLERLYGLDIDGLVVYDVQDEAERTDAERPFPFLNALDPFNFAKNHLNSIPVTKIVYRPAGKFTTDEIDFWLNDLTNHGYMPVFVGVPSPDFVPITSLNQAYEVFKKYDQKAAIGAVTIPERHAQLNDEQHRMLDKMSQGVSFFISQCILNLDYAMQVIDDLEEACALLNRPLPTIIFTITPCGSKKTLKFMEWLGIHIPKSLKYELMNSDDILSRSIAECTRIIDVLSRYCYEKNIPFGFNIESVAIRKEEIEASILLTNKVGEMLKLRGIRK